MDMREIAKHRKTLVRRLDWLTANGKNDFALAERSALRYVINNFFNDNDNALGAEQDVRNERDTNTTT